MPSDQNVAKSQKPRTCIIDKIDKKSQTEGIFLNAFPKALGARLSAVPNGLPVTSGLPKTSDQPETSALTETSSLPKTSSLPEISDGFECSYLLSSDLTAV